MVVSQEKWNATSVKVTQLEADLASSRTDHAALCKAVVNAEALADKIMFEDDPWKNLRLGDQLDAARNHMLKLAKGKQ